jgi:hypothetical protein
LTTTAKRAAAVDPKPDSQIRVPRVSKIVGFRIDPGEYRFDVDDRPAAFSLISLLQVVCGSATSDGYVISHVADSRCWRTLAESPQAEVVAALRRVERLGDGWELPGDRSQPLVERIDEFWGRARARRIVGAV